ncbi:MAG: hypothetical protein ACPG6P_10040, partial [Akkermansiaceae bacterium]
MNKIIKQLIVSILTIIMQSSIYAGPSDEGNLTKLLVDSYIVGEFKAKNISVAEACKKLNALLVEHQKAIGSASKL